MANGLGKILVTQSSQPLSSLDKVYCKQQVDPDVQCIKRNVTKCFSTFPILWFQKIKVPKEITPRLHYRAIVSNEEEEKKGRRGEEKQKQMPVSDQSKTGIQAAILVIKRHLAHLQNQKTTNISSTLLEGQPGKWEHRWFSHIIKTDSESAQRTQVTKHPLVGVLFVFFISSFSQHSTPYFCRRKGTSLLALHMEVASQRAEQNAFIYTKTRLTQTTCGCQGSHYTILHMVSLSSILLK